MNTFYQISFHVLNYTRVRVSIFSFRLPNKTNYLSGIFPGYAPGESHTTCWFIVVSVVSIAGEDTAWPAYLTSLCDSTLHTHALLNKLLIAFHISLLLYFNHHKLDYQKQTVALRTWIWLKSEESLMRADPQLNVYTFLYPPITRIRKLFSS